MSKFRLTVAVLFVLFFASSVHAADIAVDADCSLADAIIAANRDRPEGDCPAGRGTDTVILSQDITLDGSLPKITSDITIEGNGYTISGNHRYRIFYNDGGALTIHDLTMTKGRVEGDIILEDGTFKATTAQPFGGAIANWKGTVTISGSSFSDNSAERGGAIYNARDGKLNIVNSSFSNNLAKGSGAIFNHEGKISISDSSFSGNSADWGGAIHNPSDGELSIVNSAFSYNSARGDGGAINNDGDLNISDSTFSHNSAFSDDGGAIDNGWWGDINISDSTFSDNSAERGGAIYNDDGKISISDSSFSNNSATDSGGAIYNFSRGELSISGSSFSGNSADEYGGAIGNGKDRTLLSISDSSFSGNSAEYGGAIGNGEDGTSSIVNSTFSGNLAEYGGAVYNYEGTLSIINSLIAGDGEDACYSRGGLEQNIGNFIQDDSCWPAFNGDPKLDELVVLADGSPAYFPLLAGSPAIDAADNDYCLETDQIGTVRPEGSACDIGAIEYVSP